MLRSIVLLCAGLLGASGAGAACKAAPLVRWVSTPPLLGGAADTRSIVEVHRDGCVRVTLPRQMRHAGDYRVQLDDEALAEVEGLAVASPLLAFDAAAKRAEFDRLVTTAGSPVHAVLDEDIVSLQVYARQQSGRVRLSILWPSLRADRLNHPDDDALAAVDALHRHMAQLLSVAASRGEPLP